MLRTFVAALAMILLPGVAAAQSRCGQVLAQLSGLLVDATCFESTDLTTTNPATTPANNSIPNAPSLTPSARATTRSR